MKGGARCDGRHRLTDLLLGFLIASLFTIVGAVSIGAPWQIVPAGVLAGIMASVEASRVHDRESVPAVARPRPPPA
jgi:hypothetical protein